MQESFEFFRKSHPTTAIPYLMIHLLGFMTEVCCSDLRPPLRHMSQFFGGNSSVHLVERASMSFFVQYTLFYNIVLIVLYIVQYCCFMLLYIILHMRYENKSKVIRSFLCPFPCSGYCNIHTIYNS